MSIKNRILSGQNSAPIIGIVQDSLLGLFLLTRADCRVGLNVFYDTVFSAYKEESFDIQKFFGRAYNYYKEEFERVRRAGKIYYRPKNKDYKNMATLPGKLLFSTILPSDFFYEAKTDASVNVSSTFYNLITKKREKNDGIVRIENGIMLPNSEVLCKKSTGGKANSIIHYLCIEYGNDVAGKYISQAQFLNHSWLPTRGFSIGVEDCLVYDEKEIEETLIKSSLECDRINSTIDDVNDREREINNVLNSTRGIGVKLAKKGMRGGENNALYCMTASGAKGSFVNIASIAAITGQQNIEGKRMPLSLSSGRRSLYTFENNDNSDIARGFVKSSYIRGLTCSEFFFHAVCGREGIIDTGIKTALSGYIQRKIVKKLEDYKVWSDSTVRGVDGSILQFNYGNDGYDASKLYNVKGEFSFLNIERLAQRLNAQYENSQ